MRYETVIGLEIHAELSTATKLFCGCATSFGSEPNINTCPVCLALPGALPALNKTAVEYTVKAGLAMNCEITRKGRQDRKNYFYPDSPKAYQISQLDEPLCVGGWLEINTDMGKKKIRLNRIHLEEDAGKLLHDSDETRIDLNRCGTPLIEIVTEPDISNAEEAKTFLETVKSILEYIGVSDCKMEQGSLRCDVNISVNETGEELGTRTEMKNLNSFRFVTRAIEFERQRQMEELDSGNKITQETLRWDDEKGVAFSLRSKEEAQDYRYFPDPDLVRIVITDEMLNDIIASMPELPEVRKERYIAQYGLPTHNAELITGSKVFADFFESCVKHDAPPKEVSNWIIGDVSRILNEKGLDSNNIPFTPAHLAKLVLMTQNGTISHSSGKTVLAEMFQNPRDPEKIVKDMGLVQINDEEFLLGIIRDILKMHPDMVSDYKAGKEKVAGFLMGQAMRAAKGQGNPQIINEFLIRELSR